MSSSSYSPWGTIDYSRTIARGFAVVNTPRHGGFRVSLRLLRKHAIDPESILKHAIIQGDYAFFEEDCAYALVLADCPGLCLAYAKAMGFEPESVHQGALATLHHWYPKYFTELGEP